MFSSPTTEGAAGPRFDRVNKCHAPKLFEEEKFEGYHIKHALVQRNWFEVREKLRRKFPVLTSEDVSCTPDQFCNMMRKIEQKLEISPAKLQRIISEL